jgi:hypothetical protein
MDAYDTSLESLRARLSKVADDYVQQIRRIPNAETAFFIGDIVNAVENVAGDVVNATQDAVNAAVNATHDVVNAAENVVNNVAHVAVNITHNVITATEEAIHAVTNHTNLIVQTAQVTFATFKVTAEITDLIGVAAAESQGGQRGAAPSGASAAQLIQARRAAILQDRTSLVNSVLSKRTEITDRIAGLRARLSTLASRGGPPAQG